jgi:hypothetical protein
MSEQIVKEYAEYNAQGRIWGGVPQESIKKIKYPRINAKIVREFLALEDLTGTISDVLDTLGINGTFVVFQNARLLLRACMIKIISAWRRVIRIIWRNQVMFSLPISAGT